MPDKLFYFGTKDEVKLGDRVEYCSRVFRRIRKGTVVCIPEKTALQYARGGEQPEDWLIKLDDGTYTGWMFHPEDLQPPKRLRLISRADGAVEEISNAELERLDAKESARLSGLLGEFLGCATIIVLVLIGAVLLLRLF